MSDPYAQRTIARDLEQTQVVERSPLYLPWTQQIVNPFPLASSGAQWGFQAQPWDVNVLVFACSVYVNAPNTGAAFWTINLGTQAAVTLAALSTAAIAAATWTRLSTITITQPAAANAALTINPVATGAPGSIYILPTVALLRTGN